MPNSHEGTGEAVNITAAARQNIKMAVALRNMSLAKVALAAGLSRNVLSQFTSGDKNITYPNMLRICEALDVPIGLIHIEDSISLKNIALFKELELQIYGPPISFNLN